MATLLDLPMELIEMIAAQLSYADIGRMRGVHTQLNYLLVETFCKNANFKVNIKQSGTGTGLSDRIASLAPLMLTAQFADSHLFRFYDYRVDEAEYWRDFYRYQESDRGMIEKLFEPSSAEVSCLSRLLSAMVNVQGISTYDDWCTGEMFVEHEDLQVTRFSKHYNVYDDDGIWNHSCAGTQEDFECDCGEHNCRGTAGIFDLCYLAGYALAAAAKVSPGLIFRHLHHLDLFFPPSTLAARDGIWADVVNFILRCPMLGTLWVQISSTRHNGLVAPISALICELAAGIRRRPLSYLQDIYLKDNPCASSAPVPMNALIDLLQSVGSTIEQIGLVFGQLRTTAIAHAQLIRAVNRLVQKPQMYTHIYYPPDEDQRKRFDDKGDKRWYEAEYRVGCDQWDGFVDPHGLRNLTFDGEQTRSGHYLPKDSEHEKYRHNSLGSKQLLINSREMQYEFQYEAYLNDRPAANDYHFWEESDADGAEEWSPRGSDDGDSSDVLSIPEPSDEEFESQRDLDTGIQDTEYDADIESNDEHWEERPDSRMDNYFH